MNSISHKLNRGNVFLRKTRNYVNIKTLINIYFAILDSHLSYSCIFLGQNIKIVRRLITSRKKAFQVMKLEDQLFHSSPLLFSNNILNFRDKITLENIIFVSKSINRQVSSKFYWWFTFSGNFHRYETCWSITNHHNIPTFQTQQFRCFSKCYTLLELFTGYVRNKFFTQKRNLKNYKILPN